MRLPRTRYWRTATLSLVVALVLSVLYPLFREPSPIVSAQSSHEELIAYVDVDGNVWLIRPDGTERRQVTFDARIDYATYAFPHEVVIYRNLKWSPLGDRLVFVKYEEANDVNTLIIIEIAQPERPIEIARISGTGFDWSPDGTRIVYAGPEDRDGLLAYDVRSGQTSQIVKPQYGNPLRDPNWSPDGAFVSFDDMTIVEGDVGWISRLAVADLSKGGTYTLGVSDLNVLCDWLPSEVAIACVDVNVGPFSPIVGPCPIVIFDSDLRLVKQLPTQNDSCDLELRWSLDGRTIAVGALVGDPLLSEQRSFLEIVSADGSGRERIAEGVPLGWSPDGRQLLALDRQSRLETPTPSKVDSNIVVIDLGTRATTKIAAGLEAVWQPHVKVSPPQALLEEKQQLINDLSSLRLDFLGLDIQELELPTLQGYDENGAQALLDGLLVANESDTLTFEQVDGFARLTLFERSLYALYRQTAARAANDTVDSVTGIASIVVQTVWALDHFRALVVKAPGVGPLLARLLGRAESKVMDIFNGFVQIVIGATVSDPTMKKGLQHAVWLIAETLKIRLSEGESVVNLILHGIGVVIGDPILVGLYVTRTRPALEAAVTSASDPAGSRGDPVEADARAQSIVNALKREGDAAHQTYETMKAQADVAKTVGGIFDIATAVSSPSVVGAAVLQAVSLVAKSVAGVSYGFAAGVNARLLLQDLPQAAHNVRAVAFDPAQPIATLDRNPLSEVVPALHRASPTDYRVDQHFHLQQVSMDYESVLRQAMDALAQGDPARVQDLVPRLLDADESFSAQAVVSAAPTVASGRLSDRQRASLYSARTQYDADAAALFGSLVGYLLNPAEPESKTQLSTQIQATGRSVEAYRDAVSEAGAAVEGDPIPPLLVIASMALPDNTTAGQPFDLSIVLANASSMPVSDAYVRIASTGVITLDRTLALGGVMGAEMITRTVSLQADQVGSAIVQIEAVTPGGVTDSSLLLIDVSESSVQNNGPSGPAIIALVGTATILAGLATIIVVRRRRLRMNT